MHVAVQDFHVAVLMWLCSQDSCGCAHRRRVAVQDFIWLCSCGCAHRNHVAVLMWLCSQISCGCAHMAVLTGFHVAVLTGFVWLCRTS